MVTISRLYTFTNALSIASIADSSLTHQTRVLTPPLILGLQVAAKPLQIATWPLLTSYMNLQTPYPRVQSVTDPLAPVRPNRGPDSPPRKKMHVARPYGRLS